MLVDSVACRATVYRAKMSEPYGLDISHDAGTLMVADLSLDTPYQSRKIVASMTSAWPDSIDTKLDLLVPGKVDKWKAGLIAALKTRELWTTLTKQAPTMASLQEDNPEIDTEDIQRVLARVLDTPCRKRHSLTRLRFARVNRTVCLKYALGSVQC